MLLLWTMGQWRDWHMSATFFEPIRYVSCERTKEKAGTKNRESPNSANYKPNTVPASIKDAASIQKLFLSIHAVIHFIINSSLTYSKNRPNLVKRTNFRTI